MDSQVNKISVVTPSYNQSSFIEETINSVLNQTDKNLEYIIIDGGSKDQSPNIIRKYEQFLAYWVSEPDKGQSHAINKGFSHCTGDIYAWLNSDDVYFPGTFQFVREYFNEHPEVDLVYGDAEIIDQNGEFLMHRRELPVDYAMGNLIGWGYLIPQPAAFWRRRVYERIGGVNEGLNYAMDYDYWQRISEWGIIRHVPRMIARQRYHLNAKTLHMPDDPVYRAEIDQLRRRAYASVAIHKVFPYSFTPVIRPIYRLKRIFLRAIHGHYFRQYIPDPILRSSLKQRSHE